MPATTTETRPTRPCNHPNCGVPFVPTHHRSLYCVDHRTPAAALERKTLRDELDAALERAAEATRAKTEPPTPHAPTEHAAPTEPAAETPWSPHERAVAGWVSSNELDELEIAAAQADGDAWDVDEGCFGWVRWEWLLEHRTKALVRLRNIVERTKRVVGEAWTKDRPLAEAVTAKCAFLEADAQREHDGRLEAEKALSDARTTLLERGERIEVLQRELSAAETRAGYGDRVADRLNHAMLAIIEVEAACRDDIDEDELDAEWAALDAEGVSQRARELVEYVRSLRAESQVAQVPLDRATTVCGGGELDRAREVFVEAITPPGVSAAAVLRAVGYQIVTVDSPRGPVIVVEGARG
jgi:hypothetical protein